MPENMCSIRRKLWEVEQQEREACLIRWEIDNLLHSTKDNKPNKAVVTCTQQKGDSHH